MSILHRYIFTKTDSYMSQILKCYGILGILALGLSACAISDDSTDAAFTDRIDALVTPLIASNEFNGAIVMARDGHTIYSRGFGMANHESVHAFTPNTPADGGSLAKTFTASGIWWLAHEGRIDLDSPVQHYVPEYPHSLTTVRQLLSHSNGLPPNYSFFDDHFVEEQLWTTSEMLQIIANRAKEPSFIPGTQYEYSNLGFDAAAMVIERVTGQTYETFVKERFFTRLGMQSSFARPARFADWDGIRTVGYRWHEDAWKIHDSYDNEAFLGGSNLYFSAADLVLWGSAIAGGTAMPAPVFETGQQQINVGGEPLKVTGLSWYCDDQKVRCSYSGHNAGFHSFLYWDTDRKESLAFVSNSSLPAWEIATLQRQLVNALSGHPPDEDVPVIFLYIHDMDTTKITGIYTMSDFPNISVTSTHDLGIQIRLGAGLVYDAYPASRQILYVPGMDFYLGFSGDEMTRTLHIKSQEVNIVLRRI